MVSYYRDRGYAFLVLSDHRRVSDLSASASPGFVPIEGMEIDGHDPLVNGPFHMLAFGLRDLREQVRGASLATLLEAVARDGGLSIFCHPYWLGSCATDLLALDGCLGLEVFNANCEVEIGKGFSSQCWDDLLQRGKRWFGFATDDAHWRQDDAGQGWIMVKSPQLDRSSLLEAIRQGHFYSSTGPRIEHLELIGATVHVRCSPVAAIGFVGDGRHGLRVTDPAGGPITAASYERTGRERYLRVECIDRDGTRAWSNPLWLD